MASCGQATPKFSRKLFIYEGCLQQENVRGN